MLLSTDQVFTFLLDNGEVVSVSAENKREAMLGIIFREIPNEFHGILKDLVEDLVTDFYKNGYENGRKEGVEKLQQFRNEMLDLLREEQIKLLRTRSKMMNFSERNKKFGTY